MHIISNIVAFLPGMYVLRHPQGGLPPISVARAAGAPERDGKLEWLATPGTQGTTLRDGADCIVILVTEAAVDLLVTAYLAYPGAAMPTLRVDRIALDAVPAAPASRQIVIGPRGISIIAHIERTGDVVGGDGERVGDPATNLRLEGFQLMWPDQPAGVELGYSIAVEGLGALPLVKTGAFCGTRGEARRITEVTFALSGPQAAHYALVGTAHFSGGFQVALSSGMAVSGPSGLEHLTALNLRAVPDTAGAQAPANPWDASGKTKVFKTKAAATTPVVKKRAATPAAKSLKASATQSKENSDV
jgi:hypothetical protein